jgi:cytochrome oxidase Cu insertion factor (SCO1/SenC/PrrC family)
VTAPSLLALIGVLLLTGAVIGLRAKGREGGSAAGGAELRVGMPAPDFTLQASDGRTYTLSQFKGKQAVVIAWFPKAFTGG